MIGPQISETFEVKIFLSFFQIVISQDGSIYLNRIGSIQMRIKIPIFSKKIIFLAITVLFLLTKT